MREKIKKSSFLFLVFLISLFCFSTCAYAASKAKKSTKPKGEYIPRLNAYATYKKDKSGRKIAVLKKYSSLGATDAGSYYLIDIDVKISKKNCDKIEKNCKRVIKADQLIDNIKMVALPATVAKSAGYTTVLPAGVTKAGAVVALIKIGISRNTKSLYGIFKTSKRKKRGVRLHGQYWIPVNGANYNSFYKTGGWGYY